MRITCPSCNVAFELPTELLGKKGRALKCASCGHAWYQTAQVEQLDLAEIMGEKYVADVKEAANQQRAKAAAGAPAPQRAVAAAPANAGQRNRPQVQAAPIGARPAARPGTQPLPPGAV